MSREVCTGFHAHASHAGLTPRQSPGPFGSAGASPLPRSDYDPRRVCLNPFPFLERINLGKHRRTIGVYLAGGLVSPLSLPGYAPLLTHTLFHSVVLPRTLDLLRRRHPLRPRTPTI